VAAPVAAAVAWVWYSDQLTTVQIVFCGSSSSASSSASCRTFAVAPSGTSRSRASPSASGLALLAAVGQGISFAATRNGMLLMKAAHTTPPDVITVAFQRLIGGFLVALVVYVAARWLWAQEVGLHRSRRFDQIRPELRRAAGSPLGLSSGAA